MRQFARWLTVASLFLLVSCIPKGTNPDDPYEAINHKTHQFNKKLDGILLKPIAVVYKTVLPKPVRASVNNAYDNINMIPSVGNDLLQADWRWAIKDFWRFFFSSTFAKWGNPKSPYIVLPLLGPSTIRDAMGDMFEYAIMTPYPYISNNAILYSLLGVRYVDLRSQFLDKEALMKEALDPYSFVRDAYLQHRNYKIQMVLGKNHDNPAEVNNPEAD